MTRALARARTLLVVAAAVCLPTLPTLPATAAADALARYDAAARGVAAADAAYRRALVASLDADNEYERKRALEIAAAHPGIIDGDVVAALVRRLEETTPLQDSGCAHMIARLDREYGGQGEELEYARCNVRGGTSNGKLAAKLLGRRRVFGAIAARVAQRPDSVGAVLAALAPSQIGPLSELKPALDAAATAQSQQALLRLALAIDCGGGASPAPELMAPIVALQSSQAPPVSRAAALALLRLTGCGPVPDALAGARQRAAASVEARLRDLKDKDIAGDMALLGPAAAPFMPSLLARFDQAAGDHNQRKALVGVFRSAGPGAGPATARLAAALRDPKQRYLQDETLAALSAIGPTAAGTKRALLALLVADPDYVPVEIVETLAAIDARLTRAEFDPLYGDYRKSCRRAGSIYMFNLGRDEDCYRRADALERLAKRAGHPFAITGWRQPGAEEDE
jgi:hypothetical protein